MSTSDTDADDAATQALIAQLIASDFGESYADHTRPIGSHAGDYENPLTSYERQCLENPDMEDGEGGWTGSAPFIQPTEECQTFAPGTWDSTINDDPNIDPTPAPSRSEISGNYGIWENDGEEGDENEDEGGVSIEGPLHQLHDSVDFDNPQIATHPDPTRHVSQPNHGLRSPSKDSRRIITDPSRLETSIHENYNYPTENISYLRTPMAASPDYEIPIVPRSAMADGLATNERLLGYMPDSNVEPDLPTPRNKGKGKQRASPPPSRIRSDLLTSGRHATLDSWDNGKIDTSSSKNKGKAVIPDPAPDSNDEEDEEDEGDHIGDFDAETGLPFIRIPWPGSMHRERELQDRLDAQVVEIHVGVEETVDSILRDIAAREEIRGRRDDAGKKMGIRGGIWRDAAKGKEEERGRKMAVGSW